jgi:uncharacterized protein
MPFAHQLDRYISIAYAGNQRHRMRRLLCQRKGLYRLSYRTGLPASVLCTDFSSATNAQAEQCTALEGLREHGCERIPCGNRPGICALLPLPLTVKGNNMLKKHLLIIGGTLSVALGMIGIFVPVLPTTPFLLLSAFCYARGSHRLYQWLMSHRILGTYLQNYLQYHAVSKTVKIVSLIALWVSLLVSIALIGSTAVRLILVLVGIGVSLHLLMLKTLRIETPENDDEAKTGRTTDGQ